MISPALEYLLARMDDLDELHRDDSAIAWADSELQPFVRESFAHIGSIFKMQEITDRFRRHQALDLDALASGVETARQLLKQRDQGSQVASGIYPNEQWRTSTDDPANAEFRRELEVYVRGQIPAAFKKNLSNPIYWIELSIPTLVSNESWRVVADYVETAIQDASKTMTVDGQQIKSAFVVVTNHTFLADEDIGGHPTFGYLTTIKIDDYPFRQGH